MARYGRGLICLSMTPDRLDALEIPLEVNQQHGAPFDTAFCVSIDAQAWNEHRASRPPIAPRTVQAAIDPRPSRRIWRGLVTCFRCARATAACMVRAGQTEAAVDLARIAGLESAGVICEIMNDDGTMARVPELTKFAKKHGLLMITIADLIQYRMRTERLVKRVAYGGAADRARARSASSPTRTRSTTRRTSRWCAARSATARTSSSASTRSA